MNLVQKASFDTLWAKNDQSFTPISVCKVSLEIEFWVIQHPNLIKITFLKEIQTLIVEYIIEYFLLTSCKKKRYKKDYDYFFREPKTIKNQVTSVLSSTLDSCY